LFFLLDSFVLFFPWSRLIPNVLILTPSAASLPFFFSFPPFQPIPVPVSFSSMVFFSSLAGPLVLRRASLPPFSLEQFSSPLIFYGSLPVFKWQIFLPRSQLPPPFFFKRAFCSQGEKETSSLLDFFFSLPLRTPLSSLFLSSHLSPFFPKSGLYDTLSPFAGHLIPLLFFFFRAEFPLPWAHQDFVLFSSFGLSSSSLPPNFVPLKVQFSFSCPKNSTRRNSLLFWQTDSDFFSPPPAYSLDLPVPGRFFDFKGAAKI